MDDTSFGAKIDSYLIRMAATKSGNVQTDKNSGDNDISVRLLLLLPQIISRA